MAGRRERMMQISSALKLKANNTELGSLSRQMALGWKHIDGQNKTRNQLNPDLPSTGDPTALSKTSVPVELQDTCISKRDNLGYSCMGLKDNNSEASRRVVAARSPPSIGRVNGSTGSAKGQVPQSGGLESSLG